MVSVKAEKNVNKTGRANGKGAGPTKHIKLEEIWVGDRLRPLNPEKVKQLVLSIQEAGLKTPLTVRASAEPSKTGSQPWILVAGAHRLEAAKAIGLKKIRCEIFKGTEAEARIWEIRENLDRAELSALEKAEHVADLIRIKMQEGVLSQLETKPKGGRPEGGVRAAARALDIENMQASRSLPIAALSANVKGALRAANLDDNQSVLLKIVKEPDEEAQLAYVAAIAQRHSRKRPAVVERDGDTSEKNRRNLWQVLVAMTAKRLGKDLNRFVELARDTEKPGLVEFAIAVEKWRLSNATEKAGGRRSGEPKDGLLFRN